MVFQPLDHNSWILVLDRSDDSRRHTRQFYTWITAIVERKLQKKIVPTGNLERGIVGTSLVLASLETLNGAKAVLDYAD